MNDEMITQQQNQISITQAVMIKTNMTILLLYRTSSQKRAMLMEQHSLHLPLKLAPYFQRTTQC